jgi:hypothetical protein
MSTDNGRKADPMPIVCGQCHKTEANTLDQ